MSDGPLSPTPLPASQTSFAVYAGPPLDSIKTMVASEFQVKDAFLDPNGIPTVQVTREPAKEKFQRLLEQLRQQGLIAAIRGTTDGLTIKVFQKPQVKPSNKNINLGLFLATVATVFLAGYYLWTTGLFGSQVLQQQLVAIIDPTANPYLKAGLFAGGLLSIIGLHEFGHKAAARHHKMDATLPYFVPGPPPIGTFGALISLKSPPANRDQLFDLGLSGPVVGFVVTIVIAALSVLIGILPSASQATQLAQWSSTCGAQLGTSGCLSSIDFSIWPGQPLILIIISGLTSGVRPGVLLDGQLFFAAQIGALLTFLNIVPAWQLDGGHISRAVFGADGHRVASVIGLLLLFLSGYWTFGILILAFMFFSRRGFAGVEPLDDISPVSNSRKLLYILALGMLLLTFAFSPF
ncbi:site-2 protease family protein [Candidatus Bathyarchaeota archaeon]|nr:MAG: site-2 protease family protein [Candidatus Bathyarchaeota archaeon]